VYTVATGEDIQDVVDNFGDLKASMHVVGRIRDKGEQRSSENGGKGRSNKAKCSPLRVNFKLTLLFAIKYDTDFIQ
jgi:hypothetical protein